MDEIRVAFAMPVDDDGFLRRACPRCEQQFKWFGHTEGDPGAIPADQYFCPLCGAAAGTDAWWTPEQRSYARGEAAPAIEQVVRDQIADMFKGVKGVEFRPDPSFKLDVETPGPPEEPNDMVIVEPPCHPTEPLKVPDEATSSVHCLICGTKFAA